MLHHFNHLDATHDRVSTGDRRNDVSCHVLHLIERLLLDPETSHSEVGCSRDEVHYVVVVFLKHHSAQPPLLLLQAPQRLREESHIVFDGLDLIMVVEALDEGSVEVEGQHFGRDAVHVFEEDFIEFAVGVGFGLFDVLDLLLEELDQH